MKDFLSSLPDFSGLRFKCFLSNDCSKVLTYKQFLNPITHINECEFASYKCVFCEILVFRKDKIRHRYECESAPKICKHCKREIKTFYLAEHLKMAHKDFGFGIENI